MATEEERARIRLAVTRWRQRNKNAGLCHCGNERRTDESGRVRKTCAACYARTKIVTRRSDIPVVVIRTQRAFAKLTVDVTGEELASWEAFSAEFGIPLAQCVCDAMDLYISVARRHEPETPATIIEEGREAYA